MHLFAKNSDIFACSWLKDREEMCGHAVRRLSELMQRYNEGGKDKYCHQSPLNKPQINLKAFLPGAKTMTFLVLTPFVLNSHTKDILFT